MALSGKCFPPQRDLAIRRAARVVLGAFWPGPNQPQRAVPLALAARHADQRIIALPQRCREI
jgi:hypothetical protein